MAQQYICDPIRNQTCDKTHCYVYLWGVNPRCACTDREEYARLTPKGIPILATPELIDDYVKARRV